MEQILDIALRPADGRPGEAQDCKSVGLRRLQDTADHIHVDLRVPDDALLADLVPPRLKLRLDQAYHLAARRQDGVRGRQDPGQGDKGDIHTGEIRHPVRIQVLRLYIAEIGLFHTDDAGVLPELPVQLAVAHIDRIDTGGPVLEHAVGKAAGRRPDIHADPALQVDRECLHGLLELEAAPADIAQALAAHLDPGILGKSRPGLVFLLIVHIDDPRHDQRLRLLPRGGEALLCQEDIQPLFHPSNLFLK